MSGRGDDADSAWAQAPVFGAAPDAPGVAVTIRPSAYGLIASGDGRRLATVRTPAGVYLPGGGVEGDEDAAAAIVREAREECGLDVRIDPGAWRIRAVDLVHAVREGRWFAKRSTIIAATPVPPSVDASDAAGGEEADHVLTWMTHAQALAALSHAGQRWALARWLARGRDDTA